jgi:hypothetical protein
MLDITVNATAHLTLTLPQFMALAATWSGVGIAWYDLGRTFLQGRRLTLQRRQKPLLLPAPQEVRKLK